MLDKLWQFVLFKKLAHFNWMKILAGNRLGIGVPLKHPCDPNTWSGMRDTNLGFVAEGKTHGEVWEANQEVLRFEF